MGSNSLHVQFRFWECLAPCRPVRCRASLILLMVFLLRLKMPSTNSTTIQSVSKLRERDQINMGDKTQFFSRKVEYL